MRLLTVLILGGLITTSWFCALAWGAANGGNSQPATASWLKIVHNLQEKEPSTAAAAAEQQGEMENYYPASPSFSSGVHYAQDYSSYLSQFRASVQPNAASRYSPQASGMYNSNGAGQPSSMYGTNNNYNGGYGSNQVYAPYGAAGRSYNSRNPYDYAGRNPYDEYSNRRSRHGASKSKGYGDDEDSRSSYSTKKYSSDSKGTGSAYDSSKSKSSAAYVSKSTPVSLYALLKKDPDCSLFLERLDNSGLAALKEALDNPHRTNKMTVFCPDNRALLELEALRSNPWIVQEQTFEELWILQHIVFDEALYLADLLDGKIFKSWGGESSGGVESWHIVSRNSASGATGEEFDRTYLPDPSMYAAGPPSPPHCRTVAAEDYATSGCLVYVDHAPIRQPDQVAANGVLHILNSALSTQSMASKTLEHLQRAQQYADYQFHVTLLRRFPDLFSWLSTPSYGPLSALLVPQRGWEKLYTSKWTSSAQGLTMDQVENILRFLFLANDNVVIPDIDSSDMKKYFETAALQSMTTLPIYPRNLSSYGPAVDQWDDGSSCFCRCLVGGSVTTGPYYLSERIETEGLLIDDSSSSSSSSSRENSACRSASDGTIFTCDICAPDSLQPAGLTTYAVRGFPSVQGIINSRGFATWQTASGFPLTVSRSSVDNSIRLGSLKQPSPWNETATVAHDIPDSDVHQEVRQVVHLLSTMPPLPFNLLGLVIQDAYPENFLHVLPTSHTVDGTENALQSGIFDSWAGLFRGLSSQDSECVNPGNCQEALGFVTGLDTGITLVIPTSSIENLVSDPVLNCDRYQCPPICLEDPDLDCNSCCSCCGIEYCNSCLDLLDQQQLVRRRLVELQEHRLVQSEGHQGGTNRRTLLAIGGSVPSTSCQAICSYGSFRGAGRRRTVLQPTGSEHIDPALTIFVSIFTSQTGTQLVSVKQHLYFPELDPNNLPAGFGVGNDKTLYYNRVGDILSGEFTFDFTNSSGGSSMQSINYNIAGVQDKQGTFYYLTLYNRDGEPPSALLTVSQSNQLTQTLSPNVAANLGSDLYMRRYFHFSTFAFSAHLAKDPLYFNYISSLAVVGEVRTKYPLLLAGAMNRRTLLYRVDLAHPRGLRVMAEPTPVKVSGGSWSKAFGITDMVSVSTGRVAVSLTKSPAAPGFIGSTFVALLETHDDWRTATVIAEDHTALVLGHAPRGTIYTVIDLSGPDPRGTVRQFYAAVDAQGEAREDLSFWRNVDFRGLDSEDTDTAYDSNSKSSSAYINDDEDDAAYKKKDEDDLSRAYRKKNSNYRDYDNAYAPPPNYYRNTQGGYGWAPPPNSYGYSTYPNPNYADYMAAQGHGYGL